VHDDDWKGVAVARGGMNHGRSRPLSNGSRNGLRQTAIKGGLQEIDRKTRSPQSANFSSSILLSSFLRVAFVCMYMAHAEPAFVLLPVMIERVVCLYFVFNIFFIAVH